jgi:hypothetical protein
MKTIILYTNGNLPPITQEMCDLYFDKINYTVRANKKQTEEYLKNYNFSRHDKVLIEVIKELKCPGFELIEINDETYQTYYVRFDEKNHKEYVTSNKNGMIT